MKYLILITFIFSISLYSFAKQAKPTEQKTDASSQVEEPVAQCPSKGRTSGKGSDDQSKQQKPASGKSATKR